MDSEQRRQEELICIEVLKPVYQNVLLWRPNQKNYS